MVTQKILTHDVGLYWMTDEFMKNLYEGVDLYDERPKQAETIKERIQDVLIMGFLNHVHVATKTEIFETVHILENMIELNQSKDLEEWAMKLRLRGKK